MKLSVSQLSPAYHKLPLWIQHLLNATLQRAQDTHPEQYSAGSQAATRVRSLTWRWLSLLALTHALGMLLVAYAFTRSRSGGSDLTTFFLAGVLLIFLPTAARLLTAVASRSERIALLCLAGLSYYLVKVLTSPLYFAFFDEFLHWRTADDIASSQHLFHTNALLPVSPYYPGLEIVTNALSTLSGLDSFYSGLIIIGMARLMMIVALFLLNEHLLKSPRAAGIASILYMANPHFLLFDAQYGYESLALPLITCALVIMAPQQSITVRLTRLEPLLPFVKFAALQRRGLNSRLLWMTLAAWIIVGAVVLTHHVTDFFFDGLLIAWLVMYACVRLTPLRRTPLAWTALFALCASIISSAWVGNPVVTYLSSFFGEALNELGQVLTGTGPARQLFVTYSGQPTPLWERIVTISSTGMILLCLPFGLLCFWQRYRSHMLCVTFGLISLCYPLSQVFRFTNAGAELTDRAAAFLFIPLTTMLAIFIVQFWPLQQLSRKKMLAISVALTVVFLGGTLLGTGPASALLPGPYEAIADSRSIEPEGIQAALWAHGYLAAGNRIATDRINQILMGTYGDQYIVSTAQDNIDVSPVFLSAHLSSDDIAILRQGAVRYLVVDLRLTQSLPVLGFYYEQGEPGGLRHTIPISAQDLTKFSTTPRINRVFDSGDIVIYDVGGLIHAPEKS
ncbi:MAG: hypothetical protein M3Z08_12225 [Chloroflexota bacterium]|nr:hypothetical protein [Chloroflexota bacterium]